MVGWNSGAFADKTSFEDFTNTGPNDGVWEHPSLG